MHYDDEAAATDAAFFAALIAGDIAALRVLLTDDFLIVDVISGGVTGRKAFLAALDGGGLVITAIEPKEVTIRHYGGTAVVVGMTTMHGRFEGTEFTAASRYTHVYVDDGGWRLASAQGTPIPDGTVHT
jgi:ketosteroid isomerase-like protein